MNNTYASGLTKMIKIGNERHWFGGPQMGRLRSLHIRGAGCAPNKRDWVNCGFGNWGIGIVWRGDGSYRRGNAAEPVRAKAPFFFYIWPGETFDYGPDETWDETFFTFTGQRCAEWEACGWLRRANQVYPLQGDLGPIYRLHEQLMDLTTTNVAADMDFAKSIVEQLLCRLNAHHQVRHRGSRSHVQEIERLASAWREDPTKPVDFEEAANAAGMSYVTFRRKFREVVAQTPYQYLAAQRIGYACRLLMNRKLSVKEVSVQSGFEYTESFNRLFRQQMGQTPKQYRESQYMQLPKED